MSNPARIPLLWVFLPLSLGITTGHLLSSAYSVPFYLMSLALCLASLRSEPKLWSSFFLGSLFFAGFAYVTDAEKNRQIRNDFPSREITAMVRIDRLFELNDDKIRGLGRIVSTERHVADLRGARVYLSLQYFEETKSLRESVVGSSIRIKGIFTPLPRRSQQSGFHSYLVNSSVSATLERGTVLDITNDIPIWRRGLNAMLASAQTALTHRIDEDSPAARSYRAMLLGMKSELSDRHKALFLESGALHLFAISGLHIGVIAACGHALFVLFRVPRPWIPIPNLIVILAFVLVTGGAPSAWRALLMIACYYLCFSAKRQSASVNALVLSATICLIINPLQLFLAGFQMSYVTVASILLFGVPLGNRLTRHWQPFEGVPKIYWGLWQKWIHTGGRFLLSSFAISLSAFLASGALSIIYFNTISTIGVVVNLVLLPLASLVIISGFVALLLAALGLGPAVALFNHAALLVLSTMHGLLELFNRFDGSHLTFANPPVTVLFILLILLLAALLYSYSRLGQIKTRWLFLFPFAYTGVCILAATIP